MKKLIILMLLFYKVANAYNCLTIGDELIPNGSFDKDFNGFYSDYIFIATPPMSSNGVYTITNDPHKFMSPWDTFNDKSPSSNGKMFLADASSNVDDVLIGTNVTVKPNKHYIFSLWAAAVNNSNPPKIKVKINNIEQISKQISGGSGFWVKVEFEWKSLTANNAKIEIFDDNPILYGNDFVIDELSLKECIKFPTIMSTTNAPICEWEDLLLFTEKMENAAFHWYGPNGFTSDQQNPVIKRAKSFNSGKYCLYVTIDDMISDTVCIDVLVNSNLVSPGDSSLIFIGNAIKQVDFIKLTEPKKWDGGSIWLKNRFSVKQNFSTTFKFRTKYGDDKGFKDGSLPGADGFAFVMQNHNYPSLGIKGGSLGYTGITNCLAIEYDLYQNYWDPNGNHIAVQSMGAGPNQPDHGNGSCLGINDKIVTIQQDTLYYSKIDYNWDSKTLKIYVDTNGKFETPSLSIPNIDLASYLNLEYGEYVYIGFTSGTGEAYQEHDLIDWVIPCKNQMVGVEENTFLANKTDELYAYPNPANSQISISLKDEIKMNGNFYLYDFLGKLVTEGVINAGINVLNISTEMLQSGIYSLVVKFPNEVSRVKVIINK